VLLCAVATAAFASADPPAWWRSLDEQSSHEDRIVLIGQNEELTWAAIRDQGGEIDHWNLDFEAALASITLQVDPEHPEEGTWSGSLPSGTQVGIMYILEGDAGLAVYFEANDGTVLDFFETSAANLEMVGLLAKDSEKAKCVCFPEQGFTCTTEQCDESATCGTGGGCEWRHCKTLEVAEPA